MVKQILNTFKDGVYISNLEYEITYLNDTMHQRLGNEALGKKCYKAIYNKTQPCDDCYLQDLLESKSVSFKKQIGADHFMINASMLDESNKITVYTNISDIIAYEKQLELQNRELLEIKAKYEKLNLDLELALEKANENDRLKTSFLANMSHEIRTPMNAILGFSDLLKSADLTQHKKDSYFDIINSNGKRLMNIINEIVDISKIDSKELKLLPAVFNLNKLLFQLHQQFSISPINNQTTLVVHTDLPDEASYINCDENRLGQVLSNLIENALKFTPNGRIEFGYTLKANQLHFYVKDNGIGIPKKDQTLIFDRFHQSENNNTLKIKEGSGLGLAICKGIVELMGGKIWVESEENKGSTFHFIKPYCTSDSPVFSKYTTTEILPTTKESFTILIAEDEESNQLLLEAILEPYNYILIFVENGKLAVNELQNNNSIDLVFMDLNMPVMNGIEATKAIREFNTEIPIIALTAYAMAEDKQKTLDAGCTDYVSKPVKKETLLSLINTYTAITKQIYPVALS